MGADSVIDLGREAMMLTLTLAGPILIVALLIGTAVGFFQAVTQIQDSTISLVPKILAVFIALAISLPWMMERMLEFSQRMFGTMPTFLTGG